MSTRDAFRTKTIIHEEKSVTHIMETFTSLHEALRGTVVPSAKIRNTRRELDLEGEADERLKVNYRNENVQCLFWGQEKTQFCMQ